MSNYFSIGIESKIGMGFDQHRTHSQMLNKGVFAVEGAKNMVKPIRRIKDTVTECSNGDGIVFSTDDTRTEIPVLRGNPVSLIFLNINSFASGCDLWNDATASGLVNVEPVEFDSQSPGDGKLEVMSYQSLTALGWEQVRRMMSWAPSFGQRVAQLKGEIQLTFNPNVSEPIYAQIDGEFYQLDSPTKITIRHKVKGKALQRTPTDFLDD
jgi:diacylglycerol kinase (ATP)